MQNRLIMSGVLIAAITTPLFFVMRSPGFASLRAVDVTLIFVAGVAAGALLSLLLSGRRRHAA
jgi:hypothetical protein